MKIDIETFKTRTWEKHKWSMQQIGNSISKD